MWFSGVRNTFKGHHNDVLSVVFSPDGGHIKSGSADDIIRSWDAHGGCTDLHPSVPSVALLSTFLPSEVNASHIFKGKKLFLIPLSHLVIGLWDKISSHISSECNQATDMFYSSQEQSMC